MSVNETTPGESFLFIYLFFSSFFFFTAFEAGLRPGDLITHINGESVQVRFLFFIHNFIKIKFYSGSVSHTSSSTSFIKSRTYNNSCNAIEKHKVGRKLLFSHLLLILKFKFIFFLVFKLVEESVTLHRVN